MRAGFTLCTCVLFATAAQADDGAAAFQHSVDRVAIVNCIDRDWNTCSGSAVVMTPEGVLLTAAHVIRSGGPVLVMFPARDKDGRVIAEAKHYADNQAALVVPYLVVAVDAKRDLALLKPKLPRTGMKAVSISPEEVSPGQSVFAIGSGNTIKFRYSSGAVKAVHQCRFTTDTGITEGRIIDSTTDFAPGDSGGPLLTMQGSLVGINVAIETSSGTRKSIALSEIVAFMHETTAKPAAP